MRGWDCGQSVCIPPVLILAIQLKFHAGCAPAMINVNLASDTLIHCLKVSGARILLVDGDEKCRARINAELQRIEKDLDMNIVELSDQLKIEIAAREAVRIDDVYRENIKGDSPAVLFYTRYALSVNSWIRHLHLLCFARCLIFPSLLLDGLLLNVTIVAQQDFQRASKSIYPDGTLHLLFTPKYRRVNALVKEATAGTFACQSTTQVRGLLVWETSSKVYLLLLGNASPSALSGLMCETPSLPVFFMLVRLLVIFWPLLLIHWTNNTKCGTCGGMA